jgi:formate hydrogenlyase transcriptional activator
MNPSWSSPDQDRAKFAKRPDWDTEEVPEDTSAQLTDSEAQLRKTIEELKRAESLHAAEERTLELIADGASLPDVLNDLCSSIDAQSPGTISTILLMDPDGKNQLWHVAGPRVPRAWLPAISPRAIGPREGCCGVAAYLKKRVVIADIATDPRWPDANRELALQNGLRAGWSEPILTKEGELLGTFALYASEPRVPTEIELELIQRAEHIALIAIGRQRSLDALRRSEAEFRAIVDAIPQMIVVLGPDGGALYGNRSVLEYTGLTLDEVMAPDFRARIFHPEDVERLQEERRRALAGDTPFENEQRARGRDGRYRWFLIRYNPVRDAQGHTLRWYATGTDIDDRKREEERVRNENVALRDELDRSSMFGEIVGSSAPLQRVLAQVARVAGSDATVLILGETGTGKELVARAIHKNSTRARGPFICVNCAAIPPALIGSELFGHEKGAFTGAMQRRIGRFEAAEGGTIFLDEVAELPLESQVLLLRALQEREVERFGSNRPIAVDVRVVAATNRDLRGAVAQGKFREDLYYRLNVFPIQLPALRDRPEDIPSLVQYLVERYAEKVGKKIGDIDGRTLELLRAYDWPGNVRELQNVIERTVILADGEAFSVDEAWLSGNDRLGSQGSPIPTRDSEAAQERERIEAALAASQGTVSGPSGAAARLGIPRQTLESRIRALQINKYRFKVP